MKIDLVTAQPQLEACFAIRRAVFMSEQGVPEAEEWDGLEDQCLHFLAQDASGPAATLRLLKKGDSAKIQRVAVTKPHRGTGLGQAIMKAALTYAERNGYLRAILDAQTYAVPFYERLGFVAEGPEFDDAGIPHRHMVLIFGDSAN